MNVTRAVLPVMRKQRSGHIISISSSAGLAAGFDFVSAYAASKFGLEGWMESLQAEVAPFALIRRSSIRDFSVRNSSRSNRRTTPSRPSPTTMRERALVEYWKAQNGQQSGDPRSSHVRSSGLRARSRLRAVSSRAPMPLPPRNRKSRI